MYHSFLSGYSIRSLNGFKEKVLSHHLFVSAFGHFWPAVFSQGTLVAQLVYLFGITSPSRFLGRFRKAPLKTMWPRSL
jgi:hypothetical protein